MTSPIVSRERAHQKRTHHQFVPGIGYLAHDGPPELPKGCNGTKNCAPPAGTKDGTFHIMRPSHGASPIQMIWVAAENSWASTKPEKGNRLAWTVDHLKRAGWEYVGPDKGKPKRTS